MTRRSVIHLLIALPAAAAGKKSKDKGSEVQLVTASARLEDGKIAVDGRIRNVGERPIRNLEVYYEILDSDGKTLTRQHGPIEQEILGPGEESSFLVQMAFHARAISMRIEFEDGAGRELRAENTGPFQIEQ
jgi:hypothetical protein